jgi:hypothetical protein
MKENIKQSLHVAAQIRTKFIESVTEWRTYTGRIKHGRKQMLQNVIGNLFK